MYWSLTRRQSSPGGDCPSINGNGDNQKNIRGSVRGVGSAGKAVWDVDQASGDTHREVESCNKLVLEKAEIAVWRSSVKE